MIHYFSFLFLDTFQALIQYPDVVTAQAAKMVSVNVYIYIYVYCIVVIVMIILYILPYIKKLLDISGLRISTKGQ